MKDKPLVVIITLLGGAVCSICCILKEAGLLWTLLATLITLVVFMLIGMLVNHFYASVKAEVEEAEKEKKRLEEERKAYEESIKIQRAQWLEENPGMPFPEELSDEALDGAASQEDNGNL